MCRILSYLGNPIVIDELLYKPDNSFIKQSYHPKYMSHLLNLAGFGMVAWDKASYDPTLPFIYKTYHLPFYDENLRNLSLKIAPNCLLAHLRGVAYHENKIVSMQNVHPFMFEGSKLALAHNGALFEFDKMKHDLTEYILPQYLNEIKGNTDSEWIYALFLSQLKNDLYTTDDIIQAILETLKILGQIREKLDIHCSSPVNLFITDGDLIAATRFVFDYGWQPLDGSVSTHFSYHSLWYTFGERYGFYDNEYRMQNAKKMTSIIISSEPLTSDTTTWIEVPEYSLIVARNDGKEISIVSRDINF